MKLKRNRRNSLTLCPNCMSTLIVNVKGQYECTGDRLELWLEEFERFEKMDRNERQGYLNGITNTEKFMELYEKRKNLNCGYSARLVDMMPTYTTTIPDPLQVTKMEKNLGRLLTEEELEDDFVFYLDKKGKVLMEADSDETCIPFVIQRINFPDDCI